MKVLVVYHHVPIREALRGVLKELGSDITVLEAADSREAMRPVEEHPDLGLILLNLDLPDRDGFSVLSELRMSHPAISVVVMSAEQDHDTVVKALDAGALGLIPKSATREVILGAMQLVISGGVYIPPQPDGSTSSPAGWVEVGQALFHIRRMGPDLGLTERQMDELTLIMQGLPDPAVSPENLGLTELQMGVLTLMAEGSSKEGICGELGLSGRP
jgi:DNA-binding NarL/FixJ family response regulator